MSGIIEFTITEKAKIESDSYFTALEALEIAEEEAEEDGLMRTDISKRSGIDLATISKILNGRKKNITLKTLFTVMKAMDRKVFIISERIKDLKQSKSNFDIDRVRLEDVEFEVMKSGAIQLIGQRKLHPSRSYGKTFKVPA